MPKKSTSRTVETIYDKSYLQGSIEDDSLNFDFTVMPENQFSCARVITNKMYDQEEQFTRGCQDNILVLHFPSTQSPMFDWNLMFIFDGHGGEGVFVVDTLKTLFHEEFPRILAKMEPYLGVPSPDDDWQTFTSPNLEKAKKKLSHGIVRIDQLLFQAFLKEKMIGGKGKMAFGGAVGAGFLFNALHMFVIGVGDSHAQLQFARIPDSTTFDSEQIQQAKTFESVMPVLGKYNQHIMELLNTCKPIEYESSPFMKNVLQTVDHEKTEGSSHSKEHMSFLKSKGAVVKKSNRVQIERYAMAPSHAFGDFDGINRYDININNKTKEVEVFLKHTNKKQYVPSEPSITYSYWLKDYLLRILMKKNTFLIAYVVSDGVETISRQFRQNPNDKVLKVIRASLQDQTCGTGPLEKMSGPLYLLRKYLGMNFSPSKHYLDDFSFATAILNPAIAFRSKTEATDPKLYIPDGFRTLFEEEDSFGIEKEFCDDKACINISAFVSDETGPSPAVEIRDNVLYLPVDLPFFGDSVETQLSLLQPRTSVSQPHSERLSLAWIPGSNNSKHQLAFYQAYAGLPLSKMNLIVLAFFDPFLKDKIVCPSFSSIKMRELGLSMQVNTSLVPQSCVADNGPFQNLDQDWYLQILLLWFFNFRGQVLPLFLSQDSAESLFSTFLEEEGTLVLVCQDLSKGSGKPNLIQLLRKEKMKVQEIEWKPEMQGYLVSRGISSTRAVVGDFFPQVFVEKQEELWEACHKDMNNVPYLTYMLFADYISHLPNIFVLTLNQAEIIKLWKQIRNQYTVSYEPPVIEEQSGLVIQQKKGNLVQSSLEMSAQDINALLSHLNKQKHMQFTYFDVVAIATLSCIFGEKSTSDLKQLEAYRSFCPSIPFAMGLDEEKRCEINPYSFVFSQ